MDEPARGLPGSSHGLVCNICPFAAVMRDALSKAARCAQALCRPMGLAHTPLLQPCAPGGEEPEVLPLEPESADLVVSSLGLHWANDLPVRRADVQCFLSCVRTAADFRRAQRIHMIAIRS